jgi:trk system potassium uptake protein TrkH
MPAAAWWVLSMLMVIGRLEVFTVLMLFSRSFWHR